MSPILSYLPRKLDMDVGGMSIEVEPFTKFLLNFVAMKQMATERQSDKVVSDVEVCMEKVCNLTLPCWKITPHWRSSVLVDHSVIVHFFSFFF